ncbi:cell division protein FtsZ [bacterium]|nr:cell division protein FtsZ [bacterium]
MSNRPTTDRAGKPLALEFDEPIRQLAKIKVIGIGGAGGNAINRMVSDQMTGVDFIAINTDLQALDQNKASCRIQIGKNLTRGLGAGGNPEIGRKAIEENKDSVIDALAETDMVFITCGMGGGTGTGAASVVGEIAKDLGALTVGIVTRPFEFEGLQRAKKADHGIIELRDRVDTLIEIPNEKLLSLVSKNTPLEDAFKKADGILMHATKGISDVINIPGLINVDFADVRTVMSQMGDALMGSGVASGDNRGKDASEEAISSPLIDNVSIRGALGVLVNITGGKDLSLTDIQEASTVIQECAGAEANIIVGAVVDDSMENEVRVTVIATGFNRSKNQRSRIQRDGKRCGVSNDDTRLNEIPLFEQMFDEPLEQTLGEILGKEEEFSFSSKDDPNIPTFVRRNLDDQL